MDEGYLGIFRKFFDHEFWREKRRYSKAEAWIDLMQCARYSEKPKTLLDKRGVYILEYGDVYIYSRYLGERWEWSRSKVSKFLEYLEKRESITYKKKDSHRTIINITNLKVYTDWIQGKRDEKDSDQTSEEPVESQSRASEEPKKKKVKKVEKVKKEDKPKEMAEILIPLKDGTDGIITISFFDEMELAYPNVDVSSELAKARAWCISNPSKKKTAGGLKKFVNGWLGRANGSKTGSDMFGGVL